MLDNNKKIRKVKLAELSPREESAPSSISNKSRNWVEYIPVPEKTEIADSADRGEEQDSSASIRKPAIRFCQFDDFPSVDYFAEESLDIKDDEQDERRSIKKTQQTDLEAKSADGVEEGTIPSEAVLDEPTLAQDANTNKSFTGSIFGKLQKFFETARPRVKSNEKYAQEFAKEYMQANAIKHYNPFSAVKEKVEQSEDVSSSEKEARDAISIDDSREIIVNQLADSDQRDIIDLDSSGQDKQEAGEMSPVSSDDYNFAPSGEEELTPLEEILAKHAKLPLSDSELKLRPAYYYRHLETHRATTLDEVKKIARDHLPLPREQQHNIVKTNINWLMSQLYTCPNSEALNFLADSLRSADLLGIFPALAVCKSSYDRERLIFIIKKRANRLLYFHGWLTLQATYPKAPVQKALSELCSVLTEEENSVEKSLKSVNKSAFKNQANFDWLTMPLISEIANPAGRHFISNLVDHCEKKQNFTEFCQTYGIYQDLQLARKMQELMYQRDEFNISK